MTDRIGPMNRLRNVNILNVTKTSAALTLLLSTTACSFGNYDIPTITSFCVIPLLIYWGGYAVLRIKSKFEKKGRNAWSHLQKVDI